MNFDKDTELAALRIRFHEIRQIMVGLLLQTAAYLCVLFFHSALVGQNRFFEVSTFSIAYKHSHSFVLLFTFSLIVAVLLGRTYLQKAIIFVCVFALNYTIGLFFGLWMSLDSL